MIATITKNMLRDTQVFIINIPLCFWCGFTTSFNKRRPVDDMFRNKKELKARGFTVKATMKNTVVEGPPAAGVFRERRPKPTAFRSSYKPGELPLALQHKPACNSIVWKVEIDKLKI